MRSVPRHMFGCDGSTVQAAGELAFYSTLPACVPRLSCLSKPVVRRPISSVAWSQGRMSQPSWIIVMHQRVIDRLCAAPRICVCGLSQLASIRLKMFVSVDCTIDHTTTATLWPVVQSAWCPENGGELIKLVASCCELVNSG